MPFPAPAAPLLLIGGSPDGALPGELLQRFAMLAGGREARIAVITSGSRIPFVIGPRYEAFFASLCDDVRIYHLLSRAEASSPARVAGLELATGIFFSGGEQLLTTARLGATPALDIIRERHAAGAVLAGTSAGASVMSGTMIAFGQDGPVPRHASLALAPGFGFLPLMVIDQHFSQRDRLGRLITAVLYNPEHLGAGIDENTAALIRPPGAAGGGLAGIAPGPSRPSSTLEVLGAGSVTIVDGSRLEATDAPDIEALDHPLSSTGLRLHRLAHGAVFDLDTREPVAPS